MWARARSSKPGLAGILLLALSCSTALAQEGPRSSYVGLFGGAGRGSFGTVTQVGTALFPAVVGGPLDVHATGQPGTSGVGFVGLQIGHEWSYGSGLLPALEIEGLYLAGTQHATLDNPGPRLPEHTFDDTFPMHNAVLLVNGVLGFRTPYQAVTPYVGGGIGAAYISISDANSAQINPAEPGINHFNSDASSSAWAFAAQAKAGVRIAIGDRAYVFGEYRCLFVDSSDHVFGPTDYPTHVPTTNWSVHLGDMSYHLAAGGIGFKF